MVIHFSLIQPSHTTVDDVTRAPVDLVIVSVRDYGCSEITQLSL